MTPAAGRSPQYHLERAIALEPGFADPHYHLALYLLGHDHQAVAVKHLRQTVELSAASADASSSASIECATRHMFARAKQHLLRSRDQHRLAAKACHRLGLLALEAGHTAEAVAAFDQACRFDPTHAEAHFQLGRLRLRSGDIAEARGLLERALEIDYAHALAHIAMAEAITSEDERDLTQNHYLTALDMDATLERADLNERFGITGEG